MSNLVLGVAAFARWSEGRFVKHGSGRLARGHIMLGWN
jgi:hypothetical protein